jgi:hypothetical protein
MQYLPKLYGLSQLFTTAESSSSFPDDLYQNPYGPVVYPYDCENNDQRAAKSEDIEFKGEFDEQSVPVVTKIKGLQLKPLSPKDVATTDHDGIENKSKPFRSAERLSPIFS